MADSLSHQTHAIPLPVVYAVFLVSGVAALLYQLVWQRCLFTIYGTDSESIAIIVAVFLLGLGIGSLLGGKISQRPHLPAITIFAALELIVAAFGFVSIDLFTAVGSLTDTASRLTAGLSAFGLLLVPTTFMGATLPVLVRHVVDQTHSVGDSVGRLYFVNTLGAAMGCFYGAIWLFASYGLRGTAMVGVALDVLAALLVLPYALRERRRP